MKIKDLLYKIIDELGNFNDFGFNFMTSKNGTECSFTPKAIKLFVTTHHQKPQPH